MGKAKISNAIIRRLPRYRRYLGHLQQTKELTKVSSNELSELMGYTASQIRQDLNTFGKFGHQGYGYEIKELLKEINSILGLDREYKTVIVGCGHLGQAITNYTYYYKIGFKIIGLFDVNPDIVGTTINGVKVSNVSELKDFVKENEVVIGVICVNRENAQSVADALVEGGVKGIWNFAPIDLDIDKKVALESVHLSDSLHALTFMINNMDE
ncbi:MAG: redox-sensing transcriptional repressor Rex [Clostridiales bacterium]|nr:redox-sensing transcriptional repressor Rex [Candidatus Crickella caballi]